MAVVPVAGGRTGPRPFLPPAIGLPRKGQRDCPPEGGLVLVLCGAWGSGFAGVCVGVSLGDLSGLGVSVLLVEVAGEAEAEEPGLGHAAVGADAEVVVGTEGDAYALEHAELVAEAE